MNVFISYGGVADQVPALRLQALGAVNGLTVYVPPAYTRQGVPTLLDPETLQRLREADVVLGVVGAGLTDACQKELNAGLTLQRKMVVMSHPEFAPQFQPSLGWNVVVIDPVDPGGAEIEILKHLKTLDARQNAEKALVALCMLALGLLILATADRS